MKAIPFNPHLALALSLALTGCQAGPAAHPPAFVLGRAEMAATAQAAGTLVINLPALPPSAGRKVLATVADVASLGLEVQIPGQAPLTRTFVRSELVGGTAVATFSALPAGPVTVVMTALDAGGQAIGTGSRSGTITAGQITSLDVNVQLAPTLGSAVTNGLLVTGTFSNGPITPVTAAAAVAGKYQMAGECVDFAFDTDGNPVLQLSIPNLPSSNMVRFVKLDRTSGAELSRLKVEPTGTWSVTGFAVDRENHLWATFGSIVTRVDPQGVVKFSKMMPWNVTTFVPDSRGYVWAGGHVHPYLFRPDGSLALEFDIAPQAGGQIVSNETRGAIDPADNLWLAFMEATTQASGDKTYKYYLRKYSPDGAGFLTRELPEWHRQVVSDSQGGAWVATDNTISRFTALGKPGMVLPHGGQIAVDRQDFLWVYQDLKLEKRMLDGTLLATHTVPRDQTPYEMGFGPQFGSHVFRVSPAGVPWLVQNDRAADSSPILKVFKLTP